MTFDIRAGVRRLFRLPAHTRAEIFAELDDELQALLVDRIDALIARGMSPDEARREAIRKLGMSLDDARRELRASAERREHRIRLVDRVDSIAQDLRFAARSLRKQPAIAGIAIACLALGIGANTAIFSVVRAVLLESLPFKDPSRLVRLYETSNYQGKRGISSVSVPNYLDWRAQNRVFEDVAAYAAGSADLVGNGAPERVRAIRVTPSLFGVLGVLPQVGRTFLADEDQPGKAPTVILSDGFWHRRFGGDPSIVGKAVSLDNTAFTVVAIMPAKFEYPIGSPHPDLWVTGPGLVWSAQQATQRGSHFIQVVARLKPGQDSASATAQMSFIVQRIAHDDPSDMADHGIQVNTLNGVVVGSVRAPLLTLLGAVGLVLLIACANVANLLLARAAGRRREVAMRTALGAARSRIVQQFVIESVLLAFIGGVLGLAVARWGLRAILAYAVATLPRTDAVGLNPPVLGFVLVVSVVTGVLFGLVPALRASQTDLREDLTESAGRAGTGRRQHRTLSGLIVAEIALSLVLLVGAGLLVRGFVAITKTDPGLTPDHVLTFHVSAPEGRFPDSERYLRFYGPVLARLRALPGVRLAASTTLLPIQGSDWNGNFTIVGRPEESDPGRKPFAEYRVVSSDYFRTLGIPLVKGREFTEGDGMNAPPVVMVNEDFVKRYFPNEDPIGKQILPWTDKPATIVGVARSVRQVSLDQPPRSELYVAAAQTPWQLYDVAYAVSTRMAPEALAASVRAAVHEVGPDQPVFQMETMDDVISDSLQSRKLVLSLLAIFAGLAVVLAAAGVYGVMSYGVSQRAREIGIRMALGARGRDAMSMILRDAGKLALLGIVIGLAAASALSRLLTDMLYEVGAHDPVTFAAVAGLIALTALLASFLPARRASRVDPLTAIRSE
jgi:predicted permease